MLESNNHLKSNRIRAMDVFRQKRLTSLTAKRAQRCSWEVGCSNLTTMKASYSSKSFLSLMTSLQKNFPRYLWKEVVTWWTLRCHLSSESSHILRVHQVVQSHQVEIWMLLLRPTRRLAPTRSSDVLHVSEHSKLPQNTTNSFNTWILVVSDHEGLVIYGLLCPLNIQWESKAGQIRESLSFSCWVKWTRDHFPPNAHESFSDRSLFFFF